MKFTPTEDFWCEELKSQYVKGLSYTVHYPTSRLAKYAKQWLAEGKIKEVVGPAATISGREMPKSRYMWRYPWFDEDKTKSFLKRMFPWL